jgi:hypothetical protein
MAANYHVKWPKFKLLHFAIAIRTDRQQQKR